MRTPVPFSLRVLAGIATAFLLLPIFGVMVVLYFVTPPAVFFTALGFWALLALWFFLRRRASSPASAGSWSSLVGKHSAKGGLL